MANIPNNEIWYSNILFEESITPHDTSVFGASIISNTYSNGKGVITFDGDVTSVGNSAFSDCSELTSITLPSTVTSIGDRAFYGDMYLRNIDMQSGITSIGVNAFNNCQGLKSITIPNTVKTIGNYCFDTCINLQLVNILDGPEALESIGERSFYYCLKITSMTLPSTIKNIGDYAFLRCNLTHMIIKAPTPPSINLINNVPWFVPRNSVELYKSTWSTISTKVLDKIFPIPCMKKII